MECDKLLPIRKWTACEKIEQLHNIKNMNCTVKVTDQGKDCCVCSLHIKMYELYRWNQRKKDGNVGLQHLVETFYALLCYLILCEYNPTETGVVDDDDSDDEIGYGIISLYTRHLHFIKANWYELMVDKTSLSHYLIVIIENSTFKQSNIEKEKE